MVIPFGTKHKGEKIGKVLLKDPSYIMWALEQSGSGAMLAVQAEAKRLISKFDSKPILVPCFKCKSAASYFSCYSNNASALYAWCKSCDPYSQAANQGKLTNVRTFAEAMRFIQFSCGDTKGERNNIVKRMAEAKGLPRRVGDAQVDAFFA